MTTYFEEVAGNTNSVFKASLHAALGEEVGFITNAAPTSLAHCEKTRAPCPKLGNSINVPFVNPASACLPTSVSRTLLYQFPRSKWASYQVFLEARSCVL